MAHGRCQLRDGNCDWELGAHDMLYDDLSDDNSPPHACNDYNLNMLKHSTPTEHWAYAARRPH